MYKSKFESLLRDNYSFITKVCAGFSDSDQELKDLVQEVCYQVWKTFSSFRGEAKISTWIYRITINVCLYQQGLKEKEKTDYLDQESLERLFETTQELQSEDYQKNVLYVAIRKLKPEDRALIMLYLDCKTHEQIGEILGITSVNAGVRINRLKKKLKQLIEDE